MKTTELRALSVDDLKVKLAEQQEESLRRRCNKVVAQLPDVMLIRKGRKDIARIQTVIREKQLGIEK